MMKILRRLGKKEPGVGGTSQISKRRLIDSSYIWDTYGSTLSVKQEIYISYLEPSVVGSDIEGIA